jgi:hypothetical protein
MPFVSTISILTAVRAHLRGLRMPDAPEENLFHVVEFYDQKDVAEGLARLFKATAKRACLVIPGGDDYDYEKPGDDGIVMARRDTDFSLLITDKTYKPGMPAAVFGDNATFGILNLKEIVVEKLVAASLGLTGVCIRPGPGSLLEIGGAAEARPCWMQTFSTDAGDAEIIAH